MEQAIQEVFDRFIDMLANRQEEPIPIMLFGKELEQFQAQYPNEQIQVFDGTGNVEVAPEN